MWTWSWGLGVRRLGEEEVGGGDQGEPVEEMTVALSPFCSLGATCKKREETELSHPVPLICGSASTKQLYQQPLLETWSGESLGSLFKITWLAISKTMQALVKVQ